MRKTDISENSAPKKKKIEKLTKISENELNENDINWFDDRKSVLILNLHKTNSIIDLIMNDICWSHYGAESSTAYA